MDSMKTFSVGGLSPDHIPFVLGALTLLSLTTFAISLWPKIQFLRRAESENRFDKPLIRLWNTFVIAFAQTKLLKDFKAGLMHAVIFWGFLVLLLRAAQFFLMGFFPGWQLELPSTLPLENFYSLVKDGFVFLVASASVYGLYRRLVLKPGRVNLSFEGNLILLLILVIMATDVFFDAAIFSLHPETASFWSPLGFKLSATVLQNFSPKTLVWVMALSYWTHVIAILFFLNLLPRSKHFHILTSIPNVFFSRLHTGNGLHRIDFEDEESESFGVTKVEDFTWKQMLDLHTCTQCGRCDQVCPALATGKPLSPQQLTVDLRDHLNEPSSITLLGNVIADETLSITACPCLETPSVGPMHILTTLKTSVNIIVYTLT